MKLYDVMTPDVLTLPAVATCQEAARLMSKFNVGLVPVVQRDQIMGVITDRDLAVRVVAENLDASRVPVTSVMTSEAHWLHEDIELDDAIEFMGAKRISRLLIKSRSGQLVGIVSAADVAALSGHNKVGELMEILGCAYWKRHLVSLGNKS